MRTITGDKRGKLIIGEVVGRKKRSDGRHLNVYRCTCDCGAVVEKDAPYFNKTKEPQCDYCLEKSRSRCFPKFDTVDDDLRQTRWRVHNGGYAMTGGGNRKDYAHIIVLERKIGRSLRKGELADHINRDKLDNRRVNLRVADKSLNSVNRDKRPDNSSGYIGVYKYHPTQWKNNNWEARWVFRIERKGHKTYYSKLYKTAKEAHEARTIMLENYAY